MSSDAEIKKLLLSHPKVSKSSLQAVIRSKASKYRGFSTKNKEELIDMILSNKKDFKVFLSTGIKNLKPTVPATKIIKKMEVSKPVVKKAVVKKETVKKAVVKKEPVKKAVVKKSDLAPKKSTVKKVELPVKKKEPNNKNFEKEASAVANASIGVARNETINRNSFLTGLKFSVYNILQDKDVSVNEPINYNKGLINSYFEYPINEKKSTLGNLTNEQKKEYLNILDEEYGLYIEKKKFDYETVKKNEKEFNKFIYTPFSKLMKESKEFINKFRKINEENKKDAEERLKKKQQEDKKKAVKKPVEKKV